MASRIVEDVSLPKCSNVGSVVSTDLQGGNGSSANVQAEMSGCCAGVTTAGGAWCAWTGGARGLAAEGKVEGGMEREKEEE